MGDEKALSEQSPRPSRLLEQLRDAINRLHYSARTEETYVHWVKRFIYFSGKRHPAQLGAAEVTAFLNYLARERDVAAATQNQALSALLFLYKEVLRQPLPWLNELDRARRPARLPTVLTPEEARMLLTAMRGTKWLMASLLYVEFGYRQIVVRDGKGAKDRVTMLPGAVVEPLKAHLRMAKELHASTPGRSTSGGGSSCLRRRSCRPTRAPASSGVTTCTRIT